MIDGGYNAYASTTAAAAAATRLSAASGKVNYFELGRQTQIHSKSLHVCINSIIAFVAVVTLADADDRKTAFVLFFKSLEAKSPRSNDFH